MEIREGNLDYNPFSKDNTHRNFFGEVRKEFLNMNKKNVSGGVINYETWFRFTMRELLELLIGRFEWEGLPENMPKAYMEKKLLMYGSALIYEHETDGLFVGTGTRSQELNHYGESVAYQVVSPISEHNKSYTLNVDGVLVKNKSSIEPDIGLIAQYAHLLTSIRVTQSVNLNQMKMPFLLRGNEKTKESVLEQYHQVISNAPFIFIDPELEELGHGAEGAFVTNTPYNIDSLQQFYNDLENELLTKLGVNNNPAQDKKERLLVDEVNSNDDETSASIQTRLAERQIAAKKANELFGTDISVKLADSFLPKARETGKSNVYQQSNNAIEFRKQNE